MTAPGAPSGAAGGPPPVGGLADEAAQLLDAFAARLALIRLTVGDDKPGERVPGERPPGSVAPDDGDPVIVDAAEPAGSHHQCVGWCPVCRSADLLRGERPEVAGKLVDSAIVMVNALRSLLPAVPAADQSASHPSRAASGPSPDQPAPDQPAADHSATERSIPDRSAPGIERIDIR